MQSSAGTEERLQYTIEARELTSDWRNRPPVSGVSRQMTVDARDEGDALSKFVHHQQSEVVSFQPVRGRESIATIRKDDSVFLVRVSLG
jgi:hypothetical protein